MFEVRVPATSANMGPGFDCLGVSLNMYNRYFFEEIEEGLIIEGCDDKFKNKDNLIYVSMEKCFKKTGYKIKGIKIIIESSIPVSRGLGSSAACIAAGIFAANEISGNVLSERELLEIATEIEGHPDNIAPAILGGIVVSVLEDEKIIYSKVNINKDIKFCALIPEFTLSTEEAREALPNTIDYKKGVYNVGRVALMISALNNGELDLLKYACKDSLHEDYRAKFIHDFYDIKSKCSELGSLAVFLSGAGPTIMVMLENDNLDFYEKIKNYLDKLKYKWNVVPLKIDNKGTVIIK
jgi:homoserine kinase